MKIPKSQAEIQATDALDHLNIMISKQSVKIQDAQYLAEQVAKVLYKCEELHLSRSKWRLRAEQVELKLKQISDEKQKPLSV